MPKCQRKKKHRKKRNPPPKNKGQAFSSACASVWYLSDFLMWRKISFSCRSAVDAVGSLRFFLGTQHLLSISVPMLQLHDFSHVVGIVYKLLGQRFKSYPLPGLAGKTQSLGLALAQITSELLWWVPVALLYVFCMKLWSEICRVKSVFSVQVVWGVTCFKLLLIL